MEGLRRLKKIHVSTIVVSSIGGILHNIGQFMIAVFLVGYEAILHYFPFLYFAGLVAGILIGIFGKICLKKLPLLSNRS
jgi:heptaprenyl diphosphate synthase